jgi:uncharacterized membrane protein
MPTRSGAAEIPGYGTRAIGLHRENAPWHVRCMVRRARGRARDAGRVRGGLVKSKAAIGNHPIHPALVSLPIGAYFLALVGDTAHTVTAADFWYQFALVCIGVGTLAALAAAIFGFVDYFGVHMSAAAGRLATIHMAMNLGAVALYSLNFFLRRNGGALHNGRWPLVFGLEILTFGALGVSGWIGGNLSYEHKVGVIEWTDPEANEIGQKETRTSRAS